MGLLSSSASLGEEIDSVSTVSSTWQELCAAGGVLCTRWFGSCLQPCYTTARLRMAFIFSNRWLSKHKPLVLHNLPFLPA